MKVETLVGKCNEKNEEEEEEKDEEDDGVHLVRRENKEEAISVKHSYYYATQEEVHRMLLPIKKALEDKEMHGEVYAILDAKSKGNAEWPGKELF